MFKKILVAALVLAAVLTIDQGQSQARTEVSAGAAVPYWPSFGYDPQNTSRSPHPGPQSGVIAWTYPAVKGRVINNQPTVDSNGTVYFGTWGSYVEGTGNRARGMLYAINPDGSEKWVYDPGPQEGYYLGTIETSPAIGPDGTIYIGRGDGILRAVNSDGSEKWAFETYADTYGRAQIFTSPAIAEDGTIYFGTGVYKVLGVTLGTNVFYALNPDGTLKWAYPADAATGGTLSQQIFMNPAIGPDGTVYFSAGFTTYALNPDGTERWHKTSIRNMWSTAVGADGTVYVQAMYKAGGTGAIYALNPEDGSRKWMFSVPEPTVSKVVIAADTLSGTGGTLYFGSGTHETTDEPQNVGKLYAIVDCGQDCVQEKWTEPVDFGLSAGPSALDATGTIYVALRGDLDATPPVPGRVVTLRDLGERAEILWSVEANGEIWLGQPVIGPNRTLYFADAVCMDYSTCDEETDVPSLYVVGPSECVGDANGNSVGDVVDIQATAAQPGCLVYLPQTVSHWRQPWSASTSMPTTPMPPSRPPAGPGGNNAPHAGDAVSAVKP
ncbi:MAG: PQQ-binding-like beta-propeller repeat protein [Ardenticatenaceae bacterium]|nr:PQQ-binding-like beta-propeller repeat protein [Ardenticatenaceae bacterium]